MDDPLLVEGLIEQRRPAWEHFEREFKPKLLRMFASKGVTHQDQEDCYQSFCVHLVEDDGARLRQWRGDAKLLTWLNAVARNHAVDWVRATSKHQAQHAPAWDDDHVDAHADPVLAPDPANPETEAATSELVAQLRRAFEQLPPQERRVAELCYVQALSNDAIARQLGITTNNVYQIRHRVQTKLRDGMHVPNASRPPGGGVK